MSSWLSAKVLAVRALWIVGSFGDGRCGVGDHVFRLWRELAATVEIGLVATSASLGQAAKLHGLKLVALQEARLQPGSPLQPLDPAELDLGADSFPTDLAGLRGWKPHRSASDEEEITSGNRPSLLLCLGLDSFSFSRWSSVVGALDSFAPELVHLFYPSRGFRLSPLANLIPLLLSGLGQRPRLVVTLYEVSRAHPLRKLSLVSLVKQADRLVLVSEEELPRVRGIYGRDGSILVIPVGSAPLDGSGEEEGGAGVGNELSSLRTGDYLLHFGFPSRTKGLGYLIGALGVLRDWGVSLPLLLASDPDHPGIGRVMELARRRGVDHLVEVVGYLPAPSLSALAAGALALVFPFTDGFDTSRSSLLNALLLPAPVVTTQRRPRFPLLSAPPRSSEGLAVRIAELWEQARGKEGVGVRRHLISIQRWLAHRLSIKRVARAYLHTYNSLL